MYDRVEIIKDDISGKYKLEIHNQQEVLNGFLVNFSTNQMKKQCESIYVTVAEFDEKSDLIEHLIKIRNNEYLMDKYKVNEILNKVAINEDKNYYVTFKLDSPLRNKYLKMTAKSREEVESFVCREYTDLWFDIYEDDKSANIKRFNLTLLEE